MVPRQNKTTSKIAALKRDLRKELAKESETRKDGKRTSKGNVKAGYSKARPLRPTANCMFPLPLNKKNSLHRFSEDEEKSSLPLSEIANACCVIFL